MRSLPALTHLIHPVDAVTFKQEYWGRRPLLVHRGAPNYYADMFALDDVDRALSLTNVDLEGFRVVINGADVQASKLGAQGKNGAVNVYALDRVFEHYKNGSTIVLNRLEQRWEPLQRLSRELSSEMSARVQMNAYITPAVSQGFKAHYDTHDVFVVQVHGSKRWRICKSSYDLPLKSQPYDESLPEPEPDQEFDLNCGDVLYMPRGTIHWARSNNSTSAHVTIGVHPVLYSQVISDAIGRLFARDVRFRQALPIGFAASDDLQGEVAETLAGLLGSLQAELSPQEMMTDSVRQATSISFPALRHHLTDLENLHKVTAGTLVRCRPGQQWNITLTADAVTMDFHGKTIRFPAEVAEEVRYVANNSRHGLTANTIPGELDVAGRLLLVETLLQEGFLTFG